MSHFVCSACSGVAEVPGVCQTPDCSQNGDLLKECNCEDNKHEGHSRKQEEGVGDSN